MLFDKYLHPAYTAELLANDRRFLDYAFMIERSDISGYFLMIMRERRDGKLLRKASGRQLETPDSGEIQYFRIVALDVEFEVEECDTDSELL